MISAEYYSVFYYLIVTVFTVIVILRYWIKRTPQSIKIETITAFILAIFFAIFIGLRPVDLVFVDMTGYAGVYDYYTKVNIAYNLNNTNFIFDNLILFSAVTGVPKHFFFLIISCIYFIITFWATKRLFPGNTLAAYVVWLGSFSTFSYGVNGIKAGAAAAFFILAISFYKKKVISILLSIVSLGFHHSMILCIVAYIITLIYQKSGIYFCFWVFCMIVSMLKIIYFQELLAGLSDESGSAYLTTTQDSKNFGGRGGFRLDFILYSSLPIIVGFSTVFKKHLVTYIYSILFNFYLLTNAIWMLCMYASFTNRIAYLSWFVYPFVLTYPLLQMNWGKNQRVVFRLIILFS
ncbi:MAG: EpsG family protein, partial [Muribaculaceae bacterium]|nr:EpsG family protein [Muribaculaceae bacterium]